MARLVEVLPISFVCGGPISTLTDLYSLGVVLYELLADAKPYRLKRQTDAEWEEAILQGDPTRPSQALQRQADAGEGESAMLRRRARIVSGNDRASYARHR